MKEKYHPYYEATRELLVRYKQLRGNMKIHTTFRIPRNSESWPESSWGYRLGKVAYRIRYGRLFIFYRDDLEKIGFIFPEKRNPYSSLKIMRMLLRYKELHSDMRVPPSFIIPDDPDLWPREARNFDLGYVVRSMRLGLVFPDEYHDFLNAGFEFEIVLNFDYVAVKLALLRYKELHGDMMVPTKFVVPSKSSKWPEETWSLNLGAVVESIRESNEYEEHKEELLAIGFNYEPSSL